MLRKMIQSCKNVQNLDVQECEKCARVLKICQMAKMF